MWSICSCSIFSSYGSTQFKFLDMYKYLFYKILENNFCYVLRDSIGPPTIYGDKNLLVLTLLGAYGVTKANCYPSFVSIFRRNIDLYFGIKLVKT